MYEQALTQAGFRLVDAATEHDLTAKVSLSKWHDYAYTEVSDAELTYEIARGTGGEATIEVGEQRIKCDYTDTACVRPWLQPATAAFVNALTRSAKIGNVARAKAHTEGQAPQKLKE